MIIGVTGGIACGKSEVCRVLRQHGFIHIDADQVAHEILEDPKLIQTLTAEFGNTILRESGDNKVIDRKLLGGIIFNDEQKRRRLESITRPVIVEKIREQIRNQPEKDFVVEGIALISSGLSQDLDELWVVHAEPEQQLERLMRARHLTREEALARLNAQVSHDWDEATADRVIESREPIEQMVLQAEEGLFALKYHKKKQKSGEN